jgi:membrane associated rhomboid family serine protease
MHFAGNMVFLLVFGLRVNELIGDLKFAIIYPLLAIAAALSYMASISGQPLQPMLGASGAIMGLAGMYFVLFPIQRVHMAFWIRLGLWFFYLKMFRMRGFWLLVLWIGFNDILPMAFPSKHDHVAHWAHLGGFLFGMAIAIGLLAGRLATARGGDLLSVLLGRYAWPMLGKPNQNLEAPIASPNRGRRIVYAGPM